MMEATKTPTRDYPSFTSNQWDLWETMYGRRSSRKYLPMAVDKELGSRLETVNSLAVSVRQAAPESLIIETGADRAERIKRAARRGMEGAINLWMLRTPVSGFMIIIVPRDDISADRCVLLPHAAMAAEDIILWLTEAGLGTCWLAGVNDRQVRKAIGVSDEFAVPAIVSIGRPKERIKARDWDNLLYRRLSRHRKPISTIASSETYGKPFKTGKLSEGRFPVSEIQDIEGLLRVLEAGTESRGELPLGTAIEACLEAARVAPSAGNQQKWHFVAVENEKRLGEVGSACGKSRPWRAAIVGAGYPGKLYAMVEKPFWMLDLPIAFSHISLMAASMNIPCEVCVGGIDEQALNKLAGLPADLRTFGVIGLV